MSNELDKYIIQHSIPEDDVLLELTRETHLYEMHPRMLSGHIQGRFLKMITQLKKPKRALELGTFTGYSAICIAQGLDDGAKLTTVELNDEHESRIRKFIEKSGHQDKIELIIGDALQVMENLEPGFDLVFVDGDKRQYPECLELAKKIMNPGALFIADNVLWDGKVLKEDIPAIDKMTIKIKEFNKIITEDPEMENYILPLRDGLMIATYLGPSK